jgi:hypothetical protein
MERDEIIHIAHGHRPQVQAFGVEVHARQL